MTADLKQTTCILLVACAVHVGPARSQQELTAGEIAQIDSVVWNLMADRQAPAVSVAVGRGGQLVWTKGYGTADVENAVPATADTKYRTASISKWMTATAAMRLVEQGGLDLRAPIQRYCPQFPEKRWPVTARHLLTHTSGIRHYWGTNDEPRRTPEERTRLRERRRLEQTGFLMRYSDVIAPLDRFKNDSLLFEPGSRYKYSSHGFRLLGCVLRGAAGKPYAALMQELVFGPAGMENTVNDDALAVIPHRVSGYWLRSDGTVLRATYRDVSENLPAGGHLSTAADLVRFAMAFNHARLVSRASIEEMTRQPQFPNSPRPEEPPERYYGYGVNVIPDFGGTEVWLHSGGQSGTSTFLILAPERDRAVAAMSNLQGGPARDIALALMRMLLGR